jgi:hypothetical protein
MRLPSKTTTFRILMVAAALMAFVLPASWTRWLRRPFQTLDLVKAPATAAVRELRNSADAAPDPLQLENEALKRALAHAYERLALSDQRIAELTGFTSQGPDSHLDLVIAPVMSLGATPREASVRVLLRGEQHKVVAAGQWVLAGEAGPLPDEVRSDPDRALRQRADRGSLIGHVVQVLPPNVAIVQLTTDARFPQTEVRLARTQPDGRWEIGSERCVLVGIGDGRMRIAQATQDYSQSEFRIVVVPAGRELPVPMTIGRVTGAVRRTDSPQHFDLTVEPWVAPERLKHVYILGGIR